MYSSPHCCFARLDHAPRFAHWLHAHSRFFLIFARVCVLFLSRSSPHAWITVHVLTLAVWIGLHVCLACLLAFFAHLFCSRHRLHSALRARTRALWIRIFTSRAAVSCLALFICITRCGLRTGSFAWFTGSLPLCAVAHSRLSFAAAPLTFSWMDIIAWIIISYMVCALFFSRGWMVCSFTSLDHALASPVASRTLTALRTPHSPLLVHTLCLTSRTVTHVYSPGLALSRTGSTRTDHSPGHTHSLTLSFAHLTSALDLWITRSDLTASPGFYGSHSLDRLVLWISRSRFLGSAH